MKLIFLAIVCIISGLFVEEAFAGEIRQSSGCKEVGRVLKSYDSGIQDFAKLCAEGELIVGDRLKIKVSCYGQARNRWLSGGQYDIGKLCGEDRAARSACWAIPCVRSVDRISLLNPRSSIVLDLAELEWTSVDGATIYEIRISSHKGRTMQIKTPQTHVLMPNTYYVTNGETYAISLFAFNDRKALAEGFFSIRIPEKKELQELQVTLNQIESSDLSSYQKTLLVDAAYLSIGLIEHSIKYLEQALSESNSSEILSLIGDRYAEIGDLINAQKYYKIVVQQRPETSEDFKFAKQMLDRIANLGSTTIPQ